jgi:hypothetical protein
MKSTNRNFIRIWNAPFKLKITSPQATQQGPRISRAATTKQATLQESFTRRLQPRKRRRLHALVGRLLTANCIWY